MALTKAQMRDRVYLQTSLDALKKQQNDALRANETTFRQNQRLLGQYNAMNGIRGSGMDESAYVRLLQSRGAGQNTINAQYTPQMAELQGYLDILNARRSGGGRRRTTTNGPVLEWTPGDDYALRYGGYEGAYNARKSRAPQGYRI